MRDYISILECCSTDIDALLSHTTSKQMVELLKEGVSKYDEFLKLDADNSKVNRWIGYVQGVLITVGWLTVEGERNYTREFFTAHRGLKQ